MGVQVMGYPHKCENSQPWMLSGSRNAKLEDQDMEEERHGLVPKAASFLAVLKALVSNLLMS
jgi:hypothetical protein